MSACMKKSGENDKREGRKPCKRPYNPMQKPPEYHGWLSVNDLRILERALLAWEQMGMQGFP
ncbi:hypothetical protein C9F07_16400 [Salmonella enterica subsp. enterica serovar Poona]|uniref:Uncharacterized protein n=1 Tax=Salmonella enterica subsp. enterica serovar Poona TaxID=436295 RepID=A0A4Z0LRX2_SALET|nr:hypothetical protein C9F07_16400 [Salmonella enterica subsp. enterica serovar Poona]